MKKYRDFAFLQPVKWLGIGMMAALLENLEMSDKYFIFAPEFINNCNYDSTYSFYRRRFDARPD